MANKKTTKIVSKKHLARLERERRQVRIITIVSIVILAGVFISIIYGILNETVLNNFKPVVSVNGESVSISEFEARGKTARQQLIDQFMQYYNLALMFGMDPTTDASLSQTFDSIQQQLDDPANLGEQILTNIEDDLLVKQYALANGIVVTEADINKAIQEAYKYYPEGIPTSTPSATPIAFSTLSAAQLKLETATPTAEPSATPTPGPTNTAAPTAIPEPSATPVTEQGYSDMLKQGLQFYNKLGLNEKLFRKVFFESALYRERVKAVVTADVSHESEQVWARHILVADETTANTVRTLLLAGGDWNTLAKAYSVDTATKDKGGDLGWFAKGKMAAEFETAAFGMQIGELSQPVQSQYGYHIIQVLGHEIRPLTAEEFSTNVDNAFTAWLENQRSAATIVINPDWVNYVPAKPTLQDAFSSQFATQTAMAPTYQAEQQTSEAIQALTPSATPLPPTATP